MEPGAGEAFIHCTALRCTDDLSLKQSYSLGGGGRKKRGTRLRRREISRKLLGLRHGSVLVRARSQIRLTDALWRHEQE